MTYQKPNPRHLGGAAREWLGALMGWAAGRENLRRHPSSDAGRTATGYTEHAGVQQPFEQPFTTADRQEVDDDIDVYLLDADLPPQPRGYVWMIRVPDGHTSPEASLADVDPAIIRAAGSLTHPKQLRPIRCRSPRLLRQGQLNNIEPWDAFSVPGELDLLPSPRY